MLNLKDEKNEELREKIILGLITPRDLSVIDENVIFLMKGISKFLNKKRNSWKRRIIQKVKSYRKLS